MHYIISKNKSSGFFITPFNSYFLPATDWPDASKCDDSIILCRDKTFCQNSNHLSLLSFCDTQPHPSALFVTFTWLSLFVHTQLEINQAGPIREEVWAAGGTSSIEVPAGSLCIWNNKHSSQGGAYLNL